MQWSRDNDEVLSVPQSNITMCCRPDARAFIQKLLQIPASDSSCPREEKTSGEDAPQGSSPGSAPINPTAGSSQLPEPASPLPPAWGSGAWRGSGLSSSGGVPSWGFGALSPTPATGGPTEKTAGPVPEALVLATRALALWTRTEGLCCWLLSADDAGAAAGAGAKFLGDSQEDEAGGSCMIRTAWQLVDFALRQNNKELLIPAVMLSARVVE
jgi:hypothetical protein